MRGFTRNFTDINNERAKDIDKAKVIKNINEQITTLDSEEQEKIKSINKGNIQDYKETATENIEINNETVKKNIEHYKNKEKIKDELWEQFDFFTKFLLVLRSVFLIPMKNSIAGKYLDRKLEEHGCTMAKHASFGRKNINHNFEVIDNTSNFSDNSRQRKTNADKEERTQQRKPFWQAQIGIRERGGDRGGYYKMI